MFKKASFFVILSILLGLTINASATTYYFSTSGSDTNSGTSTSSPFKSIAKLNSMIASASPGDDFLFKCGDTWTPTTSDMSGSDVIKFPVDTSGTSSDWMVFGSYGTGDKPTISMVNLVNTYHRVIVFYGGQEYFKMDNIRFLHYTNLSNAGHIELRADTSKSFAYKNFKILNCEFDCSHWTQFDGSKPLIQSWSSASILPENQCLDFEVGYCYIHDTVGEDAINLRGSRIHIHHNVFENINEEAIDYSGGYDSVIEYNVVNWTDLHGFKVHGQATYLKRCIIRGNLILGPLVWGMALENIEDCQIYNNTIYGNGHNAIALGDFQEGTYHGTFSNNIIRNNIFWGYVGVYGTNPTTNIGTVNTFSNNRYHNPGGVLIGGISPAISTSNFVLWLIKSGVTDDWYGDPQLVNPYFNSYNDYGDFHPAIGSPMMDSGYNIAGYTEDIEGTSVPQGSGTDIGAYEVFQGGWASNPTPINDANHLDPDLVLSWIPSWQAVTHEVYLGTNFDDVNQAEPPIADLNSDTKVNFIDYAILASQWQGSPGSPSADIAPEGGDGIVNGKDLAAMAGEWLSDIYLGSIEANSFDPGMLEYDTTYYWRVDSINEPDMWQGEVWKFSTDINDTNSPSPDPTEWLVEPNAIDSFSITMSAVTATDISGVEYYFDCMTVGGHDSGWQDSEVYVDSGLSSGTEYTYRVKARDKSFRHNETDWSDEISATTVASNEIQFDSISSAQGGSYDGVVHGVDTLSWSHTLGSGNNKIVVVGISTEDNVDSEMAITSVKYNNVNMTLVPNSTAIGGSSYKIKTDLYYILESQLPAPGVYTVTVNWGGECDCVAAAAISLNNVAQEGPESVARKSSSTNSTGISTYITTYTNGAWLVDAIGCGMDGSFTPTSGQTERWDIKTWSSTGAGGTKDSGSAGLDTMSWSYSSTANRLAHSVAAFAPAD